jgi:hypothetical protein
MTLPADVARCPGVNLEGEWREGCSDCLRRTAPPTDHPRVSHMAPPPIIAFWCEFHIPERDDRTGELFGDEHG